MEKLVLASDHGGFALKEAIKKFILELGGYALEDLGTHSAESVDYPAYGRKAAEAVANRQADRGLIFCGTGIGISIAANKLRGVRAANCTDEFMTEMSRRHNNANILALGGRVVEPELAKKIVKVWLTTPFDGGRHEKRIQQLDN
ncbi:ribose 5-phosphate isomerase B [Candidatus Termititenax persephonae]|uniref:Ribose 5-phosphate isomerase B n=1 Tax=Candidatus Termititenax persephonae TaxID=2218525 RepID=A0A388TIP5_9BACT|nr:ribose 5-phosphate isomerase B [Candidatus Termititenax persephonae]